MIEFEFDNFKRFMLRNVLELFNQEFSNEIKLIERIKSTKIKIKIKIKMRMKMKNKSLNPNLKVKIIFKWHYDYL